MIKVNYITIKSETSGWSKYEKAIRKGLSDQVDFKLIEYKPPQISLPVFSSLFRAFNKILKLALEVFLKYDKNSVTHIAQEDLSFLLKLLNIKKSVISCHDLIYWAYLGQQKSFYWKLNMAGLKKASRIITVSEFSKKDIIKFLNYPADKIVVIPNAIDHDQYFQNRSREILKKYNISDDNKIILYVGSEQPRMNVDVLINAFAKLKEKLPKTKLLKIGNPQCPGAREKLEKLIKSLNLEKDVLFLGYIAEEDLPKWYNAADVALYPCSYAGFGVPPLEAMACGVPVITSNVTSLPEVVGDAGITINPCDSNEMTRYIYDVLTNDQLKKDMIEKGLKRAKMFNWDRFSQETKKVYEELITENKN